MSVLAGSLGALELLGDADAWQLAGGLASALYITAGILLFPRVGALVAVGLFIAGQMLTSLVLDGFGWLGVDQHTPGAADLAGAGAVVLGAWLIARTQALERFVSIECRGVHQLVPRKSEPLRLAPRKLACSTLASQKPAS